MFGAGVGGLKAYADDTPTPTLASPEQPLQRINTHRRICIASSNDFQQSLSRIVGGSTFSCGSTPPGLLGTPIPLCA
jgi:hypothetical protein